MRIDAADIALEEIEIQLLDGIRLTYGYDFREYALRPLRRNIVAAMQAEGIPTISTYQDRILHDATCMQRFLGMVGVSVTSMFREAELIQSLRDEVVPVLRTYPSVRIWMVGCATGEDVYSLAILLEEEGSCATPGSTPPTSTRTRSRLPARAPTRWIGCGPTRRRTGVPAAAISWCGPA